MPMMRLMSAGEQVAAELRKEILVGRWSGELPGVYALAAELGVNHKTVDAALRQLESDGLLLAQGAGRRRRILAESAVVERAGLRVGLLLGDAANRREDFFLEIRHQLEQVGHVALIPPKSLAELGMNVDRVAAMAATYPVDAWIVVAASREVIQWFERQPPPVFSIFGRRRRSGVAGAGPDKIPALRAALGQLFLLGHRRIVMMAGQMRRLPVPGEFERAFLNELARHGIETGDYHLPDWREDADGFRERLDALFHLTPPSALLLPEVPHFWAAMDFCAHRGIRVPGDVSLLCMDDHVDFDWCRPSVAHIRWDRGVLVRQVMRWVKNIEAGKDDRRQRFIKSHFVMGKTVGPATVG